MWQRRQLCQASYSSIFSADGNTDNNITVIGFMKKTGISLMIGQTPVGIEKETGKPYVK